MTCGLRVHDRLSDNIAGSIVRARVHVDGLVQMQGDSMRGRCSAISWSNPGARSHFLGYAVYIIRPSARTRRSGGRKAHDHGLKMN